MFVVADSCRSVCRKVIQITLDKENDGFGFTLRGGAYPHQYKPRPLLITHVRPGGSADREGTMKVRDRLLAVDNMNLANATLMEALAVLRQVNREAVFTIEYDVCVMDTVRNASGPLLIELEKGPSTQLGIALTNSHKDSSAIIIESIKQASLAERCGALHVNDQLLAVDGMRVDHMNPAEVMHLLKTSVGDTIRLEILPLSQLYLKRLPDPGGITMSSSGFSTLGSCRGLAASRLGNSRKHLTKPIAACTSTVSLSSNVTSVMQPTSHVCHTETTEITLYADQRGFGFALQRSPYLTDAGLSPLIIGNLDPEGPAEQTGVIQVGDRLLGVNGQSTEHLTVEEVTQIIVDSKPQVTLLVQFDVAESVVPSSGIFSVKLAKRGGGLGITITATKNRNVGEPLIISDVRRGSVAHRTGTIQPGDKLLSINAVRTDSCTIEDAAHILQNCDDIIQLRINKDELFSDADSKAVVYSVELVRHGGPLGITVSGTEDPFDPIVISGITQGGLSERTGALHIGDRLLAINGTSLRGKPLSEAILLLQNSGDVVTLKILKNTAANNNLEKPAETEVTDYFFGEHGTPLPSVDSAVESWDSTAVDAHPRPNSRNELAFKGGNAKVPKVSPVEKEDNNQGDDTTEHLDDGISESDWERRTQSSRGSASYDGSALAEEKEWEVVCEEFEACNQQLRELDLSRKTDEDTVSHNEDLLQSSQNDCRQLDITNHVRRFDDYNNYEDNCNFSQLPIELHKVILFKDKVYEDFGFSVSDGLFERGVYINRIRPGGPADLSGLIQPCDRILKVNDTKTHDFDCCLTVPLVASAGDKIELVVARNPYACQPKLQGSNGALPWIEDDDQEECSLPLPQPASHSCITNTL